MLFYDIQEDLEFASRGHDNSYRYGALIVKDLTGVAIYDSISFRLLISEPSISIAKFLGIWLSSALYAEVFHQNHVLHTYECAKL